MFGAQDLPRPPLFGWRETPRPKVLESKAAMQLDDDERIDAWRTTHDTISPTEVEIWPTKLSNNLESTKKYWLVVNLWLIYG